MSPQDRRETTAEKVRALVERDVARDLYDLPVRVDQRHPPTQDLVEKKLAWSLGDTPRRVRRHTKAHNERELRD